MAITRRDKKETIKTVLFSIGTFLAVFAIQDLLIKELSAIWVTLIGIAIIFFTMYKFKI